MRLELTSQQEAFRAQVARFAEEIVAPQAAAIDERDEFPRELVAEAARIGLLGVTAPREAGGLGLDYVSYALAIEALAHASATLAVIAVVNNSLVNDPLARFGSDDQRGRWLGPLATGRALGAFALSEADAGTDAANQKTTASRDGDGYRLNGLKVWVTNGTVADVAIVFAATDLGGDSPKTSAFLVPLDAPGVTHVGRADSLGVRGLGCIDIEFKDVRVTAAQMLGAAGDGFRIAMWALDGGRVAIAAQALGIGQAALEEALAHAKQREAFGQPIATYEAIQWMLADTATELDAARMLMLKAADAKDRRERSTLEASMAKLYASESAHRAADRAMQILASAGYRRGSRVERLFRDVRATEIYQGTSEAQRMIIAEGLISE
jgi:butyryl-CoA dehydrogenase